METKSGWRIPDITIRGPKEGYRNLPIDHKIFQKDKHDKFVLKKLKKEFRDQIRQAGGDHRATVTIATNKAE